MENKLNWYKIDWEKINKIYDPISEFSELDNEWWEYFKEKGLEFTDDSREPWENFYKAGLPKDTNKKYLLHWKIDDMYSTAFYYDDDQYPSFCDERGTWLDSPDEWLDLEEIKPQ